MNNFSKIFVRSSNLGFGIIPIRNSICKREFARNYWQFSKVPQACTSNLKMSIHKPSMWCDCGCNKSKFIHNKSERELVEFLTEEIIAEKKGQKMKSIPTEIDGFKIKMIGAELELTKQNEKEKIVINFNVNHTVDADDQAEAEADPTADKVDLAEMKSKPQFEVDFIKGNTTLSFTCSFLQGAAQEGEYNDVFGIDELTMYDGEWNEKIYAVAGDVLDGYLYDLLMNLLEEKGISNEFVEKVSDLSTAYEHSSYINLLERLSQFTTGK